MADDLPDAPWTSGNSDLPDAPWTAPKKESKSVIGHALEPITSYPETYATMNREAREQVGHGVEQLTGADSSWWDRTKGAGNVALGSLGYVTSPISAGLRTVVGKPIEDTTGIPKEYSEFAAGLAMPGVGLRSVAAPAQAVVPRAQQIAEASERLRVPISRAAATENIPIQSTAGALKEIPVVGAPLVQSSKNSLRELDRAVGETVAGYGSGQPLRAGDAAAEGLEKWITGKSGDISNRLYGRVDSLVDPAITRDLHATQQVVSDIMAKRANAKISGKSPAVSEVTDAIVTPGGLNYQGLKDLRSHIGDMTPQEMVAKGISPAEAKRLYGALTQDLRGIVKDAGGPDALTAWEKANRVHSVIADRRAELAKIIGTKADASPERVLDRLFTMAGSKGGADYQKLAQARRAMGPENWNEVTSAFVNRMGREKPGAEFSGDRFKTAWDALPDNSKRLLFNSTGRVDLAKSVEDIMTLSGAHKQLMKYGNPSGTGRVATLSGMVGAVWAAPLPTLASAVGGNVLARVLASPVAAKQASQWSLAYTNAATNPSPGRMLVLGSASERLAKAINRDLGGNFSGSDFMRGLQGPGIGRTEDNQPNIPWPPSEEKHGGRVGYQQGFAHGGRVNGDTKATEVQAPKINRGYDVPYLAGAANDGKIIYIDRRVPKRIKVGNRMLDPALPLRVHETTEHKLMTEKGMSYDEAHDIATQKEREWIERAGYDWLRYEAVINGHLATIKHQKPMRSPRDLYVKPYSARERKALKNSAA